MSIIFIMLTVIYAIGTVNRNVIWRDNIILFTDTVGKSPDALVPHNNLGIAYAERGRIDEAINEYITALKINPNHADVHNNLGNIYLKQGRINEAINEYVTVLKLKPDSAEAHNNLGADYANIGRMYEAEKEFQEVLNLNPGDVEARKNLEILTEKIKLMKK
jgi:Flp pilus assembly protein TadD